MFLRSRSEEDGYPMAYPPSIEVSAAIRATKVVLQRRCGLLKSDETFCENVSGRVSFFNNGELSS